MPVNFFRPVAAYVLMSMFIIASTIGILMLFGLGAALLALGLSCGIVGYLLGAE